MREEPGKGSAVDWRRSWDQFVGLNCTRGIFALEHMDRLIAIVFRYTQFGMEKIEMG
jgi:hypothetical protein